MTERIPCKNQGCSATILPNTAARTGGYCMPCKQEMERKERQRYIEQNRRDVDLYAGITDPVEILKIMYHHPPYDPLIHYVPYKWNKEKIYLSLTSEDVSRMLNYAMDLLDSGEKDTVQDILLSLVCYKNMSIADYIPKLMEHEIYYPGILFKDASKEVRDQLLDQIHHDQEHRNHLLLALAWIGDEKVVQCFHHWRQSPPKWAKELFVSPECYSQEAGWELTKSGELRNLFHSCSYAVEKVEAEDHSVRTINKPAIFLETDSSTCPWCGSRLTTLVDLEVNQPSLHFLGLGGDREGKTLKVNTCVSCSSYHTIYMDIDRNGESRWSTANQRPEYLPDLELDDYDDQNIHAGKHLRLASKPRNRYHAADWTLEPIISQIGGHPSWIQDAEYPACSCCSESMTFIGQLDWGEVEEYGEGIYYMFLCSDCRVTATLFQQT
ncbi:hypothetical protein SAMN05661091_1462 [Paenibacillus uliginis N3/975]|uniref:DUF1963 domain-containing protein n=1 Tax=Paenibacillus uliginis N3/975 TaxID=1313296 RepID=A0A1X7H0N9_9BACL|nr:DUF1963 domain-containing protein [Paenibacillus uliginis]SMF77604.1 hypothetical protein SAMN05661091_1462 [Paenibacillus uliginis N3/975]